MKVIALYNLKGGVGKTAAAVNLAYLSARDGKATLLWDLDPQGAASWCLEIDPRLKGGRKALLRNKKPVYDLIKPTAYDNLELLPSDFSHRRLDLELSEKKRPERQFRKLLSPLGADYETVFLDCPPGLGLSAESVFGAADVLLVPVIPAGLSLRALTLIDEFLAHEDLPRLRTLAFYSMVDRRKKLHRNLVDARHEGRYLFTTVPYAGDIERMAERRAPVAEFAPRSAAARAYESLWGEVREFI